MNNTINYKTGADGASRRDGRTLAQWNAQLKRTHKAEEVVTGQIKEQFKLLKDYDLKVQHINTPQAISGILVNKGDVIFTLTNKKTGKVSVLTIEIVHNTKADRPFITSVTWRWFACASKNRPCIGAIFLGLDNAGGFNPDFEIRLFLKDDINLMEEELSKIPKKVLDEIEKSRDFKYFTYVADFRGSDAIAKDPLNKKPALRMWMAGEDQYGNYREGHLQLYPNACHMIKASCRDPKEILEFWQPFIDVF